MEKRTNTDGVMNTQNIANLVLICLGVFVTGVSLTLLAPFYPSEALKKVKIYHSLSWISRLSKYPTTNPLLKGVSVTQSGVVMSAVFIATIVFTPLFGKVNITFFWKHFLPSTNLSSKST